MTDFHGVFGIFFVPESLRFIPNEDFYAPWLIARLLTDVMRERSTNDHQIGFNYDISPYSYSAVSEVPHFKSSKHQVQGYLD